MKYKIMSKNGHKTVDLNRRKAIHERCISCSGWSSQAVTNCWAHDCELYSFRTGIRKQVARDRRKAIGDYCLWCTNEPARHCKAEDCSLYPFRIASYSSKKVTGAYQMEKTQVNAGRCIG